MAKKAPKETPAERELALQVARLDREAKAGVELALVRCERHGPQYSCSWAGATGRRCGHLACLAILAGRCPEC